MTQPNGSNQWLTKAPVKQLRGTPKNVAAAQLSRRWGRSFNALNPTEKQSRRSTYNLPPDELYAVANDHFAQGMQVWEVVERLDIDAPVNA